MGDAQNISLVAFQKEKVSGIAAELNLVMVSIKMHAIFFSFFLLLFGFAALKISPYTWLCLERV